MIETLQNNFSEIFHEEAESAYFSPGRINLIGEHIDYHGGFVLPAAITKGTYALVSKRSDSKLVLYSDNFDELGIFTFDINDLKYDLKDDWTNYSKGSIHQLALENIKFESGLNIYYHGNIPNGAGLSSSASIEVLTLWVMNEIYGLKLDKVKIAQLAQKAENNFVGVNCGIMDQFAVTLGEVGHAICLNTGDLSYTLKKADFKDASIVIMNTNKKRGLEDSDYNLRRQESEEAFKIINQNNSKSFLTDYSSKDLEWIQTLLDNDQIFSRVRHVITENERVLQAVTALENNDLETFGLLLNQSHQSLKTDYEVTGLELDTLAENAITLQGVYGARMTGAGFGGAAIALVNNDDVNDFILSMSVIYKDIIGYEADFTVAQIGSGVHTLKI